MNTATTALPAWVITTCPDWCDYEHGRWSVWGDDCEIHTHHFQAPQHIGAEWGDVSVSVVIDADGRPVSWDGNVDGFDFDDPDAAEDLDAWAVVLREAAEWVRTTVRPMFAGSPQV